MTSRTRAGAFVLGIFVGLAVAGRAGAESDHSGHDHSSHGHAGHDHAAHEEGHDAGAMMELWMKMATPGQPHAFLAAMAGEWKTLVTQYEGGSVSEETEGTAHFESVLGGRCVVGKYTGTMWGQPHEGMSLDGFNNITGEYWSTWIDNMSTSLIVMDRGKLSDDGKTLEHWGAMQNPMGGDMGMHFVTKRLSDDRVTMHGYMMMPGAKDENLTMKIEYTRVGT